MRHPVMDQYLEKLLTTMAEGLSAAADVERAARLILEAYRELARQILAQNQASDGWAYYQAKSLKQNTYKVQIDHMKMNPSLDAEQKAKLIDKYQKTVDRYEEEQKEISEKAKASETARDRFLVLYGSFAGALTYLQIAILLSSLAALVKQIYFWYVSIGVGAVGIYFFVSTLLHI